jgi:N-acetylglucosamine-6-sulfatase
MLAQCPKLFSGGEVVDKMVANIDVAPTIMDAMGLQKPPHMDGESFLPLAKGEDIPWREYFLYAYYWEKNFPQSPTVFSLRSDQYKYNSYYGLWDTDELFDIQADPGEQNNLIGSSQHKKIVKEMENRLYGMMADLGGMDIPMNPPKGTSNNKRYRTRGGESAADFPANVVVEEPLNRNAK